MATVSGPHLALRACRRFGPAAVFFAAAAVILLADLWMVSAGTMRSWYCYTAYYDLLGDAFRHGQTHLRLRPDPALFALADPYDPEQNRPYRLHDALFYRGHYYLYNGPAPALVLAGVKVFYRKKIGDQHLLFAAEMGLVVLTATLLEALRRRLYPGLPWWVSLPGVLVAGLAHPMPLLLARAAIYEGALALAQVGVLAGLGATFLALARPPGVGGARSMRGWLATAGAAWAVAVCTRVSLAPAVAILCVLVAWRLFRLYRGEWARAQAGGPFLGFAVSVAFFAFPLLIGAVGHGAYNQMRFGSWHEFGVRYQLAGANVHAVTSNGSGLTAKYLAANLLTTTLHPFTLTGQFPFVAMQPAFYRGARVPGEAIAGAAWCEPYLWLALVPAALLVVGLFRRSDERQAVRNWFVLCLLAAGLTGVAPTLFVDGCQNRYLADAAPALLVLATLGGWEGLMRLGDRPSLRRAWLGLVAGCCLATVVFGILLGAFYVQYTAHLRARCPSEWYPWVATVR